jgi:hypothetical protein
MAAATSSDDCDRGKRGRYVPRFTCQVPVCGTTHCEPRVMKVRSIVSRGNSVALKCELRQSVRRAPMRTPSALIPRLSQESSLSDSGDRPELSQLGRQD